MSDELKALFESGKYQEVLDQFTQKEIQGEWDTLTEEKQIESIYYKCDSLIWLGRIKEAYQTAAISLKTYTSPKNPSYLLALLTAQHVTLFLLGRSQTDEAQSVLVKGESIMGALTDNERQTGAFWIAKFELVKGDACVAKKELKTALNYYHKALKSFETLDDPYNIALGLFLIGYCLYLKIEPSTQLEYLQQSLSLFKSLGNKAGMGKCLHIIGHVNYGKGELDTALECYERSQSLLEASNCLMDVAQSTAFSGAVYSRRNNPEKALECFQRSLAVVESLGYELPLVTTIYHLIGQAFHQKGALDMASNFFQRALLKREAQKNDYGAVKELFHLVLLSLDQEEVEQAQEYLTSLQKVSKRIPDDARGAHLRKHLAEALVLKQNPRLTEKIRAQALLKEIVSEGSNLEIPLMDPTFILMAMVALCDLLLLELKATGEPEVWEEAKDLIHQFYTKARDFQEFSMVVSALLLRAKFATVEGELDQALKYFNQARKIVKEKNLGHLLDKVDKEQKEFETDFQKWQDFIQHHTSLKRRLQQAQLEEYIREAQKVVFRSPLE